MLDNYEVRPGKFIGVCVSLDNCRLFIGSIPKDKRKDEVIEEMKKVKRTHSLTYSAWFPYVRLASFNCLGPNLSLITANGNGGEARGSDRCKRKKTI